MIKRKLNLRNQLSTTIRTYVKATDTSFSYLSLRIYGNGNRVGRIVNDIGRITTDTWEAGMQWLSDNWPADVEWPENAIRPEPRKKPGRNAAA